MMYNLLLVDVGRDSTKLHRMDVITGDYLKPRYITGSFAEQLRMLDDIIRHEKPDKIIFDKTGIGYEFYSRFTQAIHADFVVDPFGLIMYNKGDGSLGSYF